MEWDKKIPSRLNKCKKGLTGQVGQVGQAGSIRRTESGLSAGFINVFLSFPQIQR